MLKTTLRAMLIGLVLALLFIALREMLVITPAPQPSTPAASTEKLVSADTDLRHRSYRAAVQTATPSVVSIRTAIPPKNGEGKVQVSLGSGVILSSDGFIVTNDHVIRDAEAIAVQFSDGQTTRARLIGSDAATDLAVIKVDGLVLTAMTLAAEPARVGDIVLAIGYPFLLGQTVTQGIISATERLEQGFIRLVQTDAAINKGNSGGALVNADGELVGINSEVLPSQLGVQGIGFAIPADFMHHIAEQIIQHGHVVRGSLGFSGTGMQGEVRAQNASWKLSAIRVNGIDPNSSAATAGLQIDDYITHFNGDLINGLTDLLQRVANSKPGTVVQLRIKRDDKVLDLAVTIQERNSGKAVVSP